MIRKDFIMRQLEELAKILGLLLKLKTEQKTEEAINLIKEAYSGLLKLDDSFVDENTTSDVFLKQIVEKGLEGDALLAFAELLYEDGILRYENQEENAFIRLHKALILFDYLNRTSLTFSFDRSVKVERIKAILDNAS